MKVMIRGAGDLASGIAYELWLAGHEILMTDIEVPLAVRRAVSFSRAVYEGRAQVEDALGILVHSREEACQVISAGNIAVMVDGEGRVRREYRPDVLVDGIMAKRNTGTGMGDAPLVIGVGPGFSAGRDCHCVVETKRGPSLGKVIYQGSAAPNTGIPGEVGGYTSERLLRAAGFGLMEPVAEIGDFIQAGELAAVTGGVPVYAQISGVVRGMLQKGVQVKKGLKIGDVDARKDRELCYTISDKARCVGQGVLRAAVQAGAVKRYCCTVLQPSCLRWANT